MTAATNRPTLFSRIFGSKTATPSYSGFLTTRKPFITDSPPILWDTAEVDLSALYDIATSWCIDKKYLVPLDHETGDTSIYVPVIRPLDTDTSTMLFSTEFRRLCYSHQLYRFVNFLRDDAVETPTTDLINLCLRITLQHQHLADLYLNRLYANIAAFDADLDGEAVDDLDPAVDRDALGTKLSWTQVHRQCPFLWSVFLVQEVLRTAASRF